MAMNFCFCPHAAAVKMSVVILSVTASIFLFSFSSNLSSIGLKGVFSSGRLSMARAKAALMVSFQLLKADSWLIITLRQVVLFVARQWNEVPAGRYKRAPAWTEPDHLSFPSLERVQFCSPSSTKTRVLP